MHFCKNRFELLVFDERYNRRNIGSSSQYGYKCIYDMPGEFYKSTFVKKSHCQTGECTIWLLATKIEGPGIAPYVEIREAKLSGDESWWYANTQPIAVCYSPEEVNTFFKNYKQQFKVQRFGR